MPELSGNGNRLTTGPKSRVTAGPASAQRLDPGLRMSGSLL